jgi:tetratricopeptide (TPR) repeat protein
MAIIVLYIGLKANVERASQPVPGSNPEEQKRADELRGVLEADSTNLDARTQLADILYNTANWPEAIVHYRSVVRQDSTRVAALVDLGVCYFNLGNSVEAERHFLLGLAREPHHPILGIVNEQRERYDEAFEYFHRALQSAPPGEMHQPITQAIERVMQKQGKVAPPMPGGS